MPMPDENAISNVYSLIGDAGFERLVAAFYRQIPNDDLIGPMYPPDDLKGSEERLRSFLIFRFGGPNHYVINRGHPKLRMRHVPFVITQAARDRWMQLMHRALEESELPPQAVDVIQPFLEEVATFLINQSSSPSIIR